MNEASGRLKAIGFHEGTKQFKVDELRSRTDGKKYYYPIHPECTFENIPPEQREALLQNKQRILARQRELERQITEDMLRLSGFFDEVVEK